LKKKSPKAKVTKAKKAYKSPSLTTHGDVAKLTLEHTRRHKFQNCPGSTVFDNH